VLWLEVGTGGGVRQLRIPDVAVKAGSVTLVPVRLWRDTQMTSVPAGGAASECVVLECR
jgi:hypothetical protein